MSTDPAREEWGFRRRDGRVMPLGDREAADDFAAGYAGGEIVRRVIGPWETVSEPPRPPAVAHAGAPDTSGTGSDRGTGGREAQKPAQAAGLIAADLIESNPDIRGGEPVMRGTRVPAADVAGLLADGLGWHQVHEYWPSVPLPAGTECAGRQCHCQRLEPFLERREIRSPYSVSFETELPPFPPAFIPNKAFPHLAGFINALKPFHYREVADSLERLGHTAAARAVRSAAKGLEDGDA